MSKLRRRLGWMLVGLSLVLHMFTVYCFSRQPDRFAAFTVMPIWLWGGIGLFLAALAFYALRASLSLIMTIVWAITLLIGSDEARVLANFGKETPLPGEAKPYQGKPVLRVITLNCADFTHGNPARDLAAWQPDIVLLQDMRPHYVRQVADVLYGGAGDYRTHLSNGVVTRWKITREIRNPAQRDQQVTITLPGGGQIEVVNVHLLTAATNLQLWRREAWTQHRERRSIRETELYRTRQILEQTTAFPDVPVILGGDFNAPATDVVMRQLSGDLVDSFATAGKGWGDTYHRRLPVLRIDHLYATRHFTPIRSKVVMTRNSDHRMVVTDFLTVPEIK